MLCNKTEATDSPKLPKSEKSMFIMGRKNTGKIYSTKKKRKNTNRLSSMRQKGKVWDYQKLPKPSTTHPPGTPTAPPPGVSVKHRPCASLGGPQQASMANVSQPPIEKPQKYTAIRPVPLLAKTKTCKMLRNL